MIDFTSRAARADFIRTHESSVYSGTTVDGEETVVLLQKEAGMTVCTVHKEKPNWYECVDYGKDGFQEGVSYKPTAEYEELLERKRTHDFHE